MSDLNPEKILIKYFNRTLSKDETMGYLISFIEHSDSYDQRVVSIRMLSFLKCNEPQVFKILENCIITDEDFSIRDYALKAIYKLFGAENSLQILNWFSQNEKCPVIVSRLYGILKHSNHSGLKRIMEQLLERLEEIFMVDNKEGVFYLNLQKMLKRIKEREKPERDYDKEINVIKEFMISKDIKICYFFLKSDLFSFSQDL